MIDISDKVLSARVAIAQGKIFMDKKTIKSIENKSLPKSDLNSVNKRYSIVSTTPQNIPFVERLVLDSRQVAEGHTAGLSTPQQVMMTLFAMHDYMDKNRKYNKILKNMSKERYE